MNALQRLIRDWIADHPGTGGYAGIARRGGLKAGTVQAIATRPRKRQLTTREQLVGLAQGMGLPFEVVEDAARIAAGGSVGVVDVSGDGDRVALIVATTRHLSPERQDELLRRAQFLLEEEERGS